MMLSEEHTTEDAGNCWGFNLIYSGNHYEAAEVSGFGKTRIVAGINPRSFSWELKPGEDFEAPEAVMAFSHEGFNGLSQHMHHFVREHSEGRNQRILDLTSPAVQDYVIEEMSKVFSSADISYVKWDMNRIFSDVYSKNLQPEEQGEVFHRYVCGLYRCMKELTKRFPEILFEGCSSGGNRFDLGILCYFPQIWASDNTDALCRAEIQNGYSYGYPMSAVSAHVSACPNHQTLRRAPLETRFHVAAFGICGYEFNFCDMGKEELLAVKEQISLYKKWREVLQFGDFYRGRNFAAGSGYHTSIGLNGQNTMEWTCVSPDREREVEDCHVYGDELMYHGVKLKQAFGSVGYSGETRIYQDFGSRLYLMEKE